MIRRSFAFALAALAFAALPVSALAAKRIAVPGGTPVEIRMVDTVSSGTAHVGDTFEFKTASDVAIGGWIAVPAGAAGRGTVAEVEPAGGNGHPGHLKLTFDYVYAADGLKIKLTDVSKVHEAEADKGKSSTATTVGYLVLGPVGLFAHNWVKGREFVLDPSKTFTVFTDSTVHIAASQHNAGSSGDGFAH